MYHGSHRAAMREGPLCSLLEGRGAYPGLTSTGLRLSTPHGQAGWVWAPLTRPGLGEVGKPGQESDGYLDGSCYLGLGTTKGRLC